MVSWVGRVAGPHLERLAAEVHESSSVLDGDDIVYVARVLDQEPEDGLRSLAVPVRDRVGAVTAAVNVSVPAGRTSVADMRTHLPPLLATAGRISANLRVTTPVR